MRLALWDTASRRAWGSSSISLSMIKHSNLDDIQTQEATRHELDKQPNVRQIAVIMYLSTINIISIIMTSCRSSFAKKIQKVLSESSQGHKGNIVNHDKNLMISISHKTPTKNIMPGLCWCPTYLALLVCLCDRSSFS